MERNWTKIEEIGREMGGITNGEGLYRLRERTTDRDLSFHCGRRIKQLRAGGTERGRGGMAGNQTSDVRMVEDSLNFDKRRPISEPGKDRF